MILDLSEMKPGYLGPVRSMVKSKAFTMHQSKDFDETRASTELTKRLESQGCLTLLVKEGESKELLGEREQ
jgi:hypothetical protein